ncbi:DM13 domain-containing protein [Streptomyces sp. NPDC006997]|uniref:DM13 domain-containing protein n=1 Tax=Streptomyces sp. NPDC006997 TaxID=3155356 RepID=UPI0033E7B511
MGRVRGWVTRPVVLGALVVAVALVGVGLYWFQPWKVWQDETVEEALPQATAAAPAKGAEPSEEAPATDRPTTPATPAGPVTVASGELISHEHDTSGTVRLLRLSDGSHVVRLENLDTSNGPDLRVWLTDAPVKEGTAGWRVFDDGAHESLGRLKGNKGNQNYPLPAGVDPADFSSVSIWCDRFDVSFGAAELAPV